MKETTNKIKAQKQNITTTNNNIQLVMRRDIQVNKMVPVLNQASCHEVVQGRGGTATLHLNAG